MARRVRRPHGRDQVSALDIDGAAVIKTGWKVPTRDGTKERPCKLPGFLICTGHVSSADGRYIVNDAAMADLGFPDVNRILATISKVPDKIPDGLLPQDLRIELDADAVLVRTEYDEDGVPRNVWDFPGMFSEGYSCWDKLGLFCQGDGMQAIRRDEKGFRITVPCIPAGTPGENLEDQCEYSRGIVKNMACKSTGRFVVKLVHPVEDRPLHGTRDITHRFETGSDYSLSSIAKALEHAADMTKYPVTSPNGETRFKALTIGLRAILSLRFGHRRKAKAGPDGNLIDGGDVLVPKLTLTFDEEELRRRRSQIADIIRQSRMQDGMALGFEEQPVVKQISSESSERPPVPAPSTPGAVSPSRAPASSDRAASPAQRPAPSSLRRDEVVDTQAEPIEPSPATEGEGVAPAPSPDPYEGVPPEFKAKVDELFRLCKKGAEIDPSRNVNAWLAYFTERDGKSVKNFNTFFLYARDETEEGKAKHAKVEELLEMAIASATEEIGGPVPEEEEGNE